MRFNDFCINLIQALSLIVYICSVLIQTCNKQIPEMALYFEPSKVSKLESKLADTHT